MRHSTNLLAAASVLTAIALAPVVFADTPAVIAPAPTSTTTVPTTTTSTTVPATTTAPATTTTTTTTIPAGDWQCPQWVPLALEVGFQPDEIGTVDRLLFRESSCRPDAHNPFDPGTGSYGLMQINGAAWCDGSKYYPDGWLQSLDILDTCDELYDPRTNLRAALAIRDRQGDYGAWGL